MKNIKISAIIAGRNEGVKLERCLQSLFFCDEILYGDLDSSDNSIDVAQKFSCKIFKYKTFGPAGEYTQSDLIKLVSNDWVILMDPDEVIDPILRDQIETTIISLSNNAEIGDIYVPWQFYFGKKKLKGTVWGFKKNKGIVVNKNRYEILPITHYGKRLKPGFKSFFIEPNGKNVLHHYWMDDFKSFVAKHKRYLKDEGIDRYNIGQRISFLGIVYNFFYSFFYCFIIAKGYKDGFTGLFLSFYWTWYSTTANISLYKIILKSNVKSKFYTTKE